jgi:hypothetical protein
MSSSNSSRWKRMRRKRCEFRRDVKTHTESTHILCRPQDDFDYSAGGDIKTALCWVFLGVIFSNYVAVTLYYTGTFQNPDGSVAIQNFYAGYLLELTLSLDNLFAFYLIFK